MAYQTMQIGNSMPKVARRRTVPPGNVQALNRMPSAVNKTLTLVRTASPLWANIPLNEQIMAIIAAMIVSPALRAVNTCWPGQWLMLKMTASHNEMEANAARMIRDFFMDVYFFLFVPTLFGQVFGNSFVSLLFIPLLFVGLLYIERTPFFVKHLIAVGVEQRIDDEAFMV